MIDLGNLPPDMTEPPPDAYGNLAFQPSSGKAWWKLNDKWVRAEEALAHFEARKNLH